MKMRILFRVIKFSMFFFLAAFLLEVAGISIFSDSLFSGFGALFFFFAFLNEFSMIAL